MSQLSQKNKQRHAKGANREFILDSYYIVAGAVKNLMPNTNRGIIIKKSNKWSNMILFIIVGLSNWVLSNKV